MEVRNLVNNIDSYCKQNNLTRASFEKKSGLFNAAIRSWDDGEIPNLKSLIKIAEYTGISLDAWLKEGGV